MRKRQNVIVLTAAGFRFKYFTFRVWLSMLMHPGDGRGGCHKGKAQGASR